MPKKNPTYADKAKELVQHGRDRHSLKRPDVGVAPIGMKLGVARKAGPRKRG